MGHVNEMWAGTLHSACFHGACEGCLRTWIAADLPNCRLRSQLRVRCFAEGCPKFLPQTLVFHVSSAARDLALQLDNELDRLSNAYRDMNLDWETLTCPICNDYSGPTLKCADCKHNACGMCTGRWVDSQIPQCCVRRELNFRCFTPSCAKPLPAKIAIHTSSKAT